MLNPEKIRQETEINEVRRGKRIEMKRFKERGEKKKRDREI